MADIYLREYGVQTVIDFELYDYDDGKDLRVDAVHASGDTTLMKDEGAEANTTNAFADEGKGYSITLTATEMQAARIVLYVIDQGTKAWLDKVIIIHTFGNASAQYPDRLVNANVTQWSGNAVEATTVNGRPEVRIASIAANAITTAAVNDGALTAPKFAANFFTSVATGILDAAYEGTHTVRGMLRLAASTLWSKLSGAGTSTVVIRDQDDTKDRITATVDADGNRTAITRDET